MSEMVKRVAAALEKNKCDDGSWEFAAKIAIEAMRLPTSAMMAAFMMNGQDKNFFSSNFGQDADECEEWWGDVEDFKESFSDLIDEALK